MSCIPLLSQTPFAQTRFFTKGQIIHGRTYQNLAQLRAALAAFIPTYNQHWRFEKLRYQSPLEARLAFSSTLPLAA
jgi:transposase InsO family protein